WEFNKLQQLLFNGRCKQQMVILNSIAIASSFFLHSNSSEPKTMYKQVFSFFLLSHLLFIVGGYAQQPISMRSLLAEMTDFTSVTRWPVPAYSEKQASSYDRRSVSADKPGWFANGDF